MDEIILSLLKKIYDKQNELSLLHEDVLYKENSISEIHTIAIIGKIEKINGVKISKELDMTRSSISKIILKLKKKKLVDSYQSETNKKEIYYKLTEKGNEIFLEHEKLHIKWEERELEFISSLDLDKKLIVEEFLTKYNEYLSKFI
ncbi:MAG: winged helix DNA-binding protein [Fusobacteriaceae bacterium]